jgi:hypothetical protein
MEPSSHPYHEKALRNQANAIARAALHPARVLGWDRSDLPQLCPYCVTFSAQLSRTDPLHPGFPALWCDFWGFDASEGLALECMECRETFRIANAGDDLAFLSRDGWPVPRIMSREQVGEGRGRALRRTGRWKVAPELKPILRARLADRSHGNGGPTT